MEESARGGGDGGELAWTHLGSFSFSFDGKVRADLVVRVCDVRLT